MNEKLTDFAAQCRFEHPNSNKPPGFSRPTNAFEVLNRDSPGHGGGFSQGSGTRFGENTTTNDYELDRDLIQNDLTIELPVWILSCYGPGKDAPLQLFGGEPREMSFEEWRLHCYELLSQGKGAQLQGEEKSLVNNARQQIQNALNDIPGAIRYIREGAGKHPNRIDVCTGKAPNENLPGFGGAEARQSGAFGRMSPVPNAGNPFGRPAATFGQPSAPVNPFEKRPNPFEKANPFQKPGEQANPFGQKKPPNPFAKPGDHVPGPFEPGAPQNPFNRNAWGNSPGFGPNNPTTQPVGNNTFGQSPNNPFAGTVSSLRQAGHANPHRSFNGFGQPPAPAGVGAGADTIISTPAFAPSKPPTGQGGFFAGQAAPQPQIQESPFTKTTQAQPSGPREPYNGPSPDTSGPFPLRPGRHGNSILPQDRPGVPNNAQAREFITNNDNNRIKTLVRFKGFPVRYDKAHPLEMDMEPKVPFYTGQDGKEVRVWDTDNKTQSWGNARAEDVDPPDVLYTKDTVARLMFMLENGRFKDGIMPEVPLPRNDTTYDI